MSDPLAPARDPSGRPADGAKPHEKPAKHTTSPRAYFLVVALLLLSLVAECIYQFTASFESLISERDLLVMPVLFLLSVTLFIWGVLQGFRKGLRLKLRLAMFLAAILSMACPVAAMATIRQSDVVDRAALRSALRAAPFADYQAWAVGLLATPSANPGDDWFFGGETRIPAKLRPFVSNFFVSVERDPPHEGPHVQLIGGGGLSEIHWAVDVGPAGFVPHDDHKWYKWTDGVWFTYP